MSAGGEEGGNNEEHSFPRSSLRWPIRAASRARWRQLYDDYREDWSQELRDDVIIPLGLRSIYGLLRLFPRIVVRNEYVLKVLDTSEITDEVCEAIRVSTLYKEEQKEDDRSSGYGSYYNFDRSDYRPPSMPPPLLPLGYESAPPLFGQNEEPPARVPQVQLDRKMLALVRSWIKPPVRADRPRGPSSRRRSPRCSPWTKSKGGRRRPPGRRPKTRATGRGSSGSSCA
ncbi:hypothetical protein M3Y99_01378700 [Aphelenchoides fujianensis]|nr:hypothetical protein M3Y99_01378700 [Aphelenchoides fujianensis]